MPQTCGFLVARSGPWSNGQFCVLQLNTWDASPYVYQYGNSLEQGGSRVESAGDRSFNDCHFIDGDPPRPTSLVCLVVWLVGIAHRARYYDACDSSCHAVTWSVVLFTFEWISFWCGVACGHPTKITALLLISREWGHAECKFTIGWVSVAWYMSLVLACRWSCVLLIETLRYGLPAIELKQHGVHVWFKAERVASFTPRTQKEAAQL